MKKFLITMLFLLGLFSFSCADNVDDAISWMYDNGLTIHNNKTDFNATRGLRRDEAAKFYVNFSKLLGKTSYIKTANECTFSDINNSRSDLKDIVVESCRLGLFQGSRGKFYPTDQLTNAQAVTVLIRLLAGNQNEVWVSHRADNYYTKANELGILSNVSMNTKDNIATRGNVGVIIWNGKNPPSSINQNTISSNKINFKNRGEEICKRQDTTGLPNTNWGADAKFINQKLQDVWDNGQHLVTKYINEANQILNSPGLTSKDRCRYSWLIDALQTQKGYLKSYKTENGITTIGIDFISYQDDISKIKYDGSPRLSYMKNTSTKLRYYKLSSSPELQTLNLDTRGYVLGEKYINNFNTWLNEHCNNNPIYNGERRYEEKRGENGIVIWEGYTDEINRKQENGVTHFCVKDRLPDFTGFMGAEGLGLQFNSVGDLQKINLNRRHMFLAG